MPSGYVLGISAFYHDSAACLLSGETIVAAAQEERFTRVKGDERFPRHAARYCLAEAGIPASELDAVVFYEKPLLKFERLIETYLDIAPHGLDSFRRAGPLWMKERLHVERAIRSGLEGYKGKLLYTEHHESHAASAYYPSPFDEAAILTIDGVGEWATATIGVGRGAELELLEEMRFPDSLGLLYSAFTYHAGFRVNSGEYKLMGLAPFGQPRYVDRIHSDLLKLDDDGSFTLDQQFFDYRGGLRMTNREIRSIVRRATPTSGRSAFSTRNGSRVFRSAGLRRRCASHRETHSPTNGPPQFVHGRRSCAERSRQWPPTARRTF